MGSTTGRLPTSRDTTNSGAAVPLTSAGKLIVGLQPKQVGRGVAGHEGATGIGKGGHLALGGSGTPALGHGV